MDSARPYSSLPPIPRLMDYPVLFSVGGVVIFTMILIYIIKAFDPTGGTLTISLIVVLAFMAVVCFTIFFNVPTDEITSSVIGGLVASFGAVIAYWLGRDKGQR